jgi:hypothetical protein
MSDRPFSHPYLGHELQVRQQGRKVSLIFVAGTRDKADAVYVDLLRQLKAGAVNITIMGKPTRITES